MIRDLRIMVVVMCVFAPGTLLSCAVAYEEAYEDDGTEIGSISQGLSKTNHQSVSDQALSAFNIIARDSLKQTCILSDTNDVQRNTSAYHFLNCYWDASVDVIFDGFNAAINHALDYHAYLDAEDLDKAFTQLGYMVHGIQDFYAHSNWIETHSNNEQVDFFSPKPVDWYSALYDKILYDPKPAISCDGLPHSDMTKDTDAYPGFQEAYNDAVITTTQYMNFFFYVLYLNSASVDDFIDTMIELGFYNASSYWSISDVVRYPDGYIYFFFTNGEYFRFVDDGAPVHVDLKYPNQYPMPVTDHWTGLWNGKFDAATDWSNGYAYFFKGSQYTKMSLSGHTTLSGYPKPIVGTGSGWKNWPSSWANGNIDAVVMWSNGHAYFFRGSEYIKVRLSDYTVVSGYPKPIIGSGSGWKNWPSSFASGIDGALMRNNEHAYFFKGNQYIRVDLINYTLDPDNNYPLYTKDSWTGL